MTTFHLNAAILNTNETERACVLLFLFVFVKLSGFLLPQSPPLPPLSSWGLFTKFTALLERDIGSMYYRILCTAKVAVVYKQRECAPARHSLTNKIRNVEIACDVRKCIHSHETYRKLYLTKTQTLCGLYTTRADNDNN